MYVWSDLLLFNKIAEVVGNRYVAARYLAKQARRFAKKVPGSIIESRLFDWILTGKHPDEVPCNPKIDPDLRYLEELICYVLDEDVKDAVRKCYSKSCRHNHLIYHSEANLDEYQRQRVSILLRMIWYETR